MIPVLYPSTETSFTTNGLGGLPDAISCVVTEQRNTQGGYYLEMEYPIDGLHFDLLAPERIIYAAPAMGKTPQPFRISRITRPINGIVHIEAPHISAQLQKISTYGTWANQTFGTLTYGFAQTARELGQTVPFTFSTDRPFPWATVSFPEPTPFMDILLGAEGSILDTYGGEYEFNKYQVFLHNERGVDSGLEIRYGVNMSDIEAETDASELVTAVIPYWKGTVNDADVVVVGDMCSASNASAYAYVRCVPLDVSQQFDLEQDQQPTKAQVTAKGTAFINGTGRKLLQTSIKVKYEPTTNGIGERLINLCDTVRVVYPDLGVSSISKVVETRFNTLTEQYDELTIGSIRNNIVDTIAGLISGGAITGGGGSSGGGGGSAVGAVLYNMPQSLNEAQKAQARSNIGAAAPGEGGGGSTAVTSVNGKTGAVVLNATDVGAMPNTYTAPVTSVNGMTGDVVVSGGGGGAVDSVNGQTGVVVLTASDVGAVAAVSGKGLSTNDFTTAEKNKLSGIEAGAEVNNVLMIDIADDGSMLYKEDSITTSEVAALVANGKVVTGRFDAQGDGSELLLLSLRISEDQGEIEFTGISDDGSSKYLISAKEQSGDVLFISRVPLRFTENYAVSLNTDGTVNTKDSKLKWSVVSSRLGSKNYADYLLVTWGNSLFTAKADEKLTTENGDVKFIADCEHDGIQRHVIFTLTSENALQTTLIETYARVPITVWEVQDVTQGLIALNTNISSSLAWQLTGLNLAPFKRIKVYVKAGRKTGALSADSSITPASIIEMSMDNRAMENASQNVFIGSSVVQNPNDPNRLGIITCAVSGDKTKFAVLRATTLYGTAATSNTDAYPYVFKIEGYYD